VIRNHWHWNLSGVLTSGRAWHIVLAKRSAVIRTNVEDILLNRWPRVLILSLKMLKL